MNNYFKVGNLYKFTGNTDNVWKNKSSYKCLGYSNETVIMTGEVQKSQRFALNPTSKRLWSRDGFSVGDQVTYKNLIGVVNSVILGSGRVEVIFNDKETFIEYGFTRHGCYQDGFGIQKGKDRLEHLT